MATSKLFHTECDLLPNIKITENDNHICIFKEHLAFQGSITLPGEFITEAFSCSPNKPVAPNFCK